MNKLLKSIIISAVTISVISGTVGRDSSILISGYSESASINSMTYFSAGDGPVIRGSGVDDASYGFVMPIFNGGNSEWDDVSDDLQVNVKINGEWKNIDTVKDFVYNSNWGHWFDSGFTGYWFIVDKTTEIQLVSKSNPDVTLDYTLEFTKIQRTDYRLTPTGDTTLKADEQGAVGLVLPYIDGGYPCKSELDRFVYEVFINGEWIALDDTESGFSYRSNGYSTTNSSNQWGYWEDTVFGLWFRPITENYTIRVGYPENGLKGNSCGDNYVVYEIIGNPEAPRPDMTDAEPIELGTNDDFNISGWKLIWNDEFSGDSIDASKWSHETGYYLGDDPNTWGWGNNELEYYTDSEKNSFVHDGKLTLKLIDEPASFEQNPDRIAPYSSGKLVTKDKFSFKYGRIDFCAKLPTGNGIWPALWMLPNDSVYGTWAASGEIDVMESRGRINNSVCGTIHYGGTWPSNKYSGNDYYFDDGKTYDDGFHVYSCVWEQDKICWYVDGECYSVIPYTEWYSDAAPDNQYAPFDEEFYIIMNLAAGGNFDGGIEPDKSAVPSEMDIEYVRVYQLENDTLGTYTDTASEDINIAYLVRLNNYILGRTKDGKGLDFDENGTIDIFDMAAVRMHIVKRR